MKYLSILIIIIALASCNDKMYNTRNETSEKNKIKTVMKMQEKAWNDGDIVKFMQGYWKSDSLKFVGRRGITYGWQTTLDNYKKSYPDTKTMGKLHFEIDLIEKLSNDTYYLIGRYSLKREKDEPGGFFNLIWRKIDGKWKIITDMTCG